MSVLCVSLRVSGAVAWKRLTRPAARTGRESEVRPFLMGSAIMRRVFGKPAKSILESSPGSLGSKGGVVGSWEPSSTHTTELTLDSGRPLKTLG